MYDELREAGYERYVIEALETLEQSQLDVNCESMGAVACENDCGLMEGECAKRGGDWEVVDEPCENFHVFMSYDMDMDWDESCVLMELKMPTINVNSLIHEKSSFESEKVIEPLILKNKTTNELESEIACEFEVVTLESNDSWTKHDEKCENSFKEVGFAPNLSNEYELIEIYAKRGRCKRNFILSDGMNLNPSCEPWHIKDEYWSESEIFGMNVHGFKPTYLLFELKLCELFTLSNLVHYLYDCESCSSLFDKLMRSLNEFLD